MGAVGVPIEQEVGGDQRKPKQTQAQRVAIAASTLGKRFMVLLNFDLELKIHKVRGDDEKKAAKFYIVRRYSLAFCQLFWAHELRGH